MARIRKSRTLTLSDEVFDGLQALAAFRKYHGDTNASASKIVEDLAREYLKDYQTEITAMQNAKAAMQDEFNRQLSLFNFGDDSAK